MLRVGAELRLTYGAWTKTGVPPGSCAFVWPEAGGLPVPIDGAFTLDLATRLAPP